MVNSLLLTPTIFPCCEQCWCALYGGPKNFVSEWGERRQPSPQQRRGRWSMRPACRTLCKGTAKMAFFHGSYALSEVKVCITLIMSIKEAPPTDVRAEVRY